MDSASNGASGNSEGSANVARSTDKPIEGAPQHESELSGETEEQTCAPPFAPPQDKEVVIRHSPSPRDMNAIKIDSASNGASGNSKGYTNEAKSMSKLIEGATQYETDISREKEEQTCAPPYAPPQDKEVVIRQSPSRRDRAAAAVTDDGNFERGENGENWPLSVTASDAANATKEATQKEKCATATEEQKEKERAKEGEGRGHVATGRQGQEHDGHGGRGGGEGGAALERVSLAGDDDDDGGQVKRLMEPESISASQAARSTPERRDLSREKIGAEKEDKIAPLTKSHLERGGDEAGVRRDARLGSMAAVQKEKRQSGEEARKDRATIGEGQRKGRVKEGVTQSRSNKNGAQISEKFECDDPSCEVCEFFAKVLKTTTLDESSMASMAEELSRTIEDEEESGGEEGDGAVKAGGGLRKNEDRVADAAAAAGVSSSVAHKDVPQNKVRSSGRSGGDGGDPVHDVAGRMPDEAGGGARGGERGGEGVAKEATDAGEARAAGATRRRRESKFANASVRDISRRDEEEREGGEDGGSHRGHNYERDSGRESVAAGRQQGKSFATDKKEVCDNCAAEETAAAAAAEEEGQPSEAKRNGDAPFREDRRAEGGEMRSGGDKEGKRAVQIVVDEAAKDEDAGGGGVKPLSRASALMSLSMPEIGSRNRLSAEPSVPRNGNVAGDKKSHGRPPPPKLRIAFPQSVDQHLLEQCERETNMSRLSSSMGRM